MIVYRCQNDKGIGPYRDMTDQQTPRWIREHNMDMIHHPTVYYDEFKPPLVITEAIDKHWRCGFATWAQVISWFKSWQIEVLESLGFPLIQFEVPDEFVIIGNCQCLFDMKEAKLIGGVDEVLWSEGANGSVARSGESSRDL